MKLTFEYEPTKETGYPAGTVNFLSIFNGDGADDGEVDVHVSGDETNPQALTDALDRAIAILTDARDYAAILDSWDLEGGPDEFEWEGFADRLCACGCGRPVAGHRADSKYASAACRTRHFRALRAAQQEQGTR